MFRMLGFAFAAGAIGFGAPVLFFPPSEVGLVADRTILPVFIDQAAQAANPDRPISQSTALHLQVDLSNRQVGLYRGKTRLKTYPIAIGQNGWETPTGTFQVNQKILNPRWIHPLTNQMFAADDPQNPLGGYWIGFWTDGHNSIGFHGTPDPNSIGLASSHGCLRMYDNDVRELFNLVSIGTPVTVTY